MNRTQAINREIKKWVNEDKTVLAHERRVKELQQQKHKIYADFAQRNRQSAIKLRTDLRILEMKVHAALVRVGKRRGLLQKHYQEQFSKSWTRNIIEKELTKHENNSSPPQEN